MIINYGNVQSDARVGSPDALPEMQDILGYRMGLGPGSSDWPIYAKELLQTGKGSPAPVLPRLAR